MKFIVSKDQVPRIVTDRNGPPAAFAADELARYLGCVLNAEIRVVDNKQKITDVPVIHLEIADDKSLTDEGYELIAENADCFRIRAAGGAGLVFGTYDFLRRYAGCRFSGYAPEGEYVPRRDRIEIPSGTIRMKPELWYRGLQFVSRISDADLILKRLDWMAKNGMNYVMILPQFEAADTSVTTIDPASGQVIAQSEYARVTNAWFRRNMLPEMHKRGLKLDMNHHNFFYWLPPEKYFETHPEWYAQVDGTRSRKPLQLCICTSNREAVAMMIENMLQCLRDNPEIRVIGLIPEDGIGMCQCDECRKMDVDPVDATKPFKSHRFPEGENRSKSRRYALLLNEVARAIAKEFPHVKVGGAAYVDLQWPPRDVKLEPNIVIWVAIYWRCAAHALAPDTCHMNEFFLDILEQWRASQSCEIIFYEYYMGMNSQKGLPYPMAEVITREWPRLKALGIGGATIQSREQDHNVYALNYMAFARMGWQAKVDYPALLAEFLEGMFGPLAELVRPVYEAFDRQASVLAGQGSDSPFAQPVPPSIGCLLPSSRNVAYFLEPVNTTEIIARLESEAAEIADKSKQRQAADFIDALRYWQMAAELYRAAYAVTQAEKQGDKDGMREIARQTLTAWEPEFKRFCGLPTRGWIRTPEILWSKDGWGEFDWFGKLLEDQHSGKSEN